MKIAVAGSSGLIGSQVCRLTEASGHQIVRMSRTDGIDLLDVEAVTKALTGVEAVIDVSRPAQMELSAARNFFEMVARNLGDAGRATGVQRTVVLSIVGIEDGQDYDWYIATLAHEQAIRDHAPGARVLRTTQFHEFPGQALQRALVGREPTGTVEIMDVPTQPVDSAEVARALLEIAIDPDAGSRQLAGPQQERLVDLVRELVVHDGLDLTVLPGPAPAVSMAAGSMLPGPDVPTAGVDWHTWLRDRRG
ncbi:nucleoside-diphosphate sugar epimerase [Microlunatus endophyticus]|uniref:Nucleoside-diphosphate sugar epimerase n=1 Tax=Microlunatus endophyticus TaxID=1716077 RepID=A0A917S480_9ACTN|nr:NAD(P)H-binding protein [Microlunatus endophyticus]GGL53298.1 nucleoside-diphosphate sugar epimerase [Microlunatus endophyticus]